jgi:acyl-CoA reductase-like NAD-dependent aldehyde dehydrogenase
LGQGETQARKDVPMTTTTQVGPTTGAAAPSGLKAVLAEQQRAFQAEGPPTAKQRRATLDELVRILMSNRKPIAAALKKDFGSRSTHETEIAEIIGSANALRYARRHVAKWMQPRRRSTGIWFIPAGNRLIPQPKGAVGIISPWNYPVNLTVGPLAAAVAAGNRVMAKTSEFTPATGDLLARLVAGSFPREQIHVLGGGVEVAQEFSSLPFDHLLFTGSTAVGRHVMRAAAENLTPVTLELGGKSPVIVGEDYPLERAVDRIVWGKLFNAGQTCIAPDYVLVPGGREKEFAELAQAAARRLYPKLAGNDDYTAVINNNHYQRLSSYVSDARDKGAAVETATDPTETQVQRKLPLTVILGATDDMRVLQDEIFGPVLPVLGYSTLDEAIGYVNARPRPLALYLFSDRADSQAAVLERTTSGGVALNDTLLHYLQDDLPFGGIGSSGMGSYHGKEGFDTFSHLKPVFSQRGLGGRTGAQLLYPPYGPVTGALLRLMRKI